MIKKDNTDVINYDAFISTCEDEASFSSREIVGGRKVIFTNAL